MENYITNRISIRDYFNMQKKVFFSLTGWCIVRGLHVNKKGVTLAQAILKEHEDFDFNAPPPLDWLVDVMIKNNIIKQKDL